MSFFHSIIIVDDEEDLANLFKEYLSRLGYNVIAFTNSKLALEHLQQNLTKYSLVITDMRMPGMNGIELANNIRKLYSEKLNEKTNNISIKIVLITAYDISELQNKREFNTAKFDKVIKKPIRFPFLSETVESVLKHT